MAVWNAGTYVIGTEDDGPITTCMVVGLDSVLYACDQVRAGSDSLIHVPDISISSVDPQATMWLQEWQKKSEKRDILIRDNRKDRWVVLRGAFVSVFRAYGQCEIALDSAEQCEPPTGY